MYRIEIWQWGNLSEVYEEEDVQDVLAWYKWYWYDAYEHSLCSFSVYKNGMELSFEELDELGFY